MISRLLLPSRVRLATYSCVRSSRRIRARQIMYSARLASLLPPRLRRCLTTLPEEFGKWETAYRRYELWLRQGLLQRILEALGEGALLGPATKNN